MRTDIHFFSETLEEYSCPEAFQRVVRCKLCQSFTMLSPVLLGTNVTVAKTKQRRIQSVLPPSQTVTLFLPISDTCLCFGTRMLLVASTSWKASLKEGHLKTKMRANMAKILAFSMLQ